MRLRTTQLRSFSSLTIVRMLLYHLYFVLIIPFRLVCVQVRDLGLRKKNNMTIIVPWLRAGEFITIFIHTYLSRVYSLWTFLNVMNLVEWPTRLNVGIMMFLAAFTTYLLRINMSINILGMVKSSNNTDRTPDVLNSFGGYSLLASHHSTTKICSFAAFSMDRDTIGMHVSRASFWERISGATC